MMKKIILLFALFFIISCSENEHTPPVSDEFGNGILVINEGLYGQNNASLTFISDEKVYQNLYSSQNDGDLLGDTANDFLQVGNVGFIVVDYSRKVEVIDLQTFESKGFIDFSNYGNPRFITQTDLLTAFVTTTSDFLVKIDLQNLQILSAIQVGSKPEQMAKSGNFIIVANSGFGNGKSLSVVNLSTNSEVSQIPVWINPRFVQNDEENIYVVSTGKYDSEGIGAITKFDNSSFLPTDTLFIPQNPGEFAITDENIFVVNSNGILKIDKQNFTISDSIFIDGFSVNSLNGIIYEIYYDEQTNSIWLGNPKDFMQDGQVLQFDLSGNLISKFNCGLNPGKISRISINK